MSTIIRQLEKLDITMHINRKYNTNTFILTIIINKIIITKIIRTKITPTIHFTTLKTYRRTLIFKQ